MDVKNKLIDIFKQQANIVIDDSNLTLDVNDLGIDSLTRVRIAVEVERVFDISIEEKELRDLKSVQQLYNLIKSKVK